MTTQTPTAWDDLRLYKGAHGDTWRGQQCAVEVSNLIAAGLIAPPPGLLRCERLEPAPFSDDHPSISRAIRAFVASLNDAWGDEPRQRLKPYAAKILGTATGPEAEERRAWMATDWLVRRHTPAFLRLAGLDAHARALEGLARITGATHARAAQPAIDAAVWDAAGEEARDAAGDAAWDAAAAAAGEAARDAVWAAAAAGNAARDAAWDAAREAAGDAAWAAARAAPGVAARSEAGAVAADAVWNAARAAAWAAAVDAAADAARGALAPTVEELQDSALELLDEMIELDTRGGDR